jgi:MoxR-like ATPase
LPTFRVLASMNPFDDVGTARISDSVYDRWCRLAVDYQDAAEEEAIVVARTGCSDDVLVADAVVITRATRSHPDPRRGSHPRFRFGMAVVTAMPNRYV